MRLQIVISCLTMFSVLGCGGLSQSEKGNQLTQSASAEADASIVGGYSKADLADPDIREVAAFALESLRSRAVVQGSWEIVAGETQVVAGLNFRFRAKETGAKKSAEIIVYQNLEGQLSITSVKFLD